MNEDKFKKATESLMSHCRQRMGYEKDPDVHYVTDKDNAEKMLGYTAHYQPENKIVTIYISGRHPKDALRSLAHELVHHAQNCRGDLKNSQTEEGYAQKDPHMRKMEEEAYLEGNMMFRDWEDTCKSQNTFTFVKGENKMTINQYDTVLRNMILEKTEVILKEEHDIELEEGFLDRLMARGSGAKAGLGQKARNLGAKFKGAKAGFALDDFGVAAAASSTMDPKELSQIVTSATRMKKFYTVIGKVANEMRVDMDKLGFSQKDVKDAMRFIRSGQTYIEKILVSIIEKDRTGTLAKKLGMEKLIGNKVQTGKDFNNMKTANQDKKAAGLATEIPAAAETSGINPDRLASLQRNRNLEEGRGQHASDNLKGVPGADRHTKHRLTKLTKKQTKKKPDYDEGTPSDFPSKEEIAQEKAKASGAKKTEAVGQHKNAKSLKDVPGKYPKLSSPSSKADLPDDSEYGAADDGTFPGDFPSSAERKKRPLGPPRDDDYENPRRRVPEGDASRIMTKDRVKHREDDWRGTGKVVGRSGRMVLVMWSDGQQEHDEGMLLKQSTNEVDSQSELAEIKKNQDSINSLNENRLMNINRELMRRLIK